MTDPADTLGVQRRRWRVNPGVRVLEHQGTLLLRTGDRIVKVRAPNLVPVVRHLLDEAKNGEIDLAWLSDVPPEHRNRLEGVLRRLEEVGLLTEADEEPVENAAVVDGLWARSDGDIPRAEISRRLSATRVGVMGAGVLAERIAGQLSENGVEGTIRIREPSHIPDRRLDLAVAVGRGEEDPFLGEWNERSLAAQGPPWLAVMPLDGRRVVTGPWIFPHTSACFACFRLRRASAFLDEEVGPLLTDTEPVGPDQDVAGLYPALTTLQAAFAADLVVQHVALRGSFGQAQPGGLTTLEYGLFGIEAKNHRVLRVPRCPKCSPAEGGGYPQVWFHRDAAPEGEG